ncbi:IS3 family transposase [Exiguobacterium aurantiacum]
MYCLHEIQTYEELKSAIVTYIPFYNVERIPVSI